MIFLILYLIFYFIKGMTEKLNDKRWKGHVAHIRSFPEPDPKNILYTAK